MPQISSLPPHVHHSRRPPRPFSATTYAAASYRRAPISTAHYAGTARWTLRQFRATSLLVGTSALALSTVRADRDELAGLLAQCAEMEIDIAVVGKAPGAEWAAGLGHQTDRVEVFGAETGASSTTVAIGYRSSDAAMRSCADIYFHLGDPDDLVPRRGSSVPVTGQGVAGLINAVRWTVGSSSGYALPQIQDVADHARRCADSYAVPGKVDAVLSYAVEAASALQAEFPQIQAVLGTGFPFYCVERARDSASGDSVYPTPNSIHYFTSVQAEFFNRKVVPAGAPQHTPHTLLSLIDAGFEPGQSAFNAFEYSRWGASPPEPPGQGAIEDYFAANVLEPAERIWPCGVCTAVHDTTRFPRQAWVRDFMRSCARCHQTAFLPRAVGVLGSDVDLIAVVEGEARDGASLAAEIATWIDGHPVVYRHDTNWPRQLASGVGPLDVFTIGSDEFWAGLGKIAAGRDWMATTARCDVGWLPITRINYEIGKYFPLCVELLDGADDSFNRRFDEVQASFTSSVSPNAILEAYRADSPYLRQLASNASIADLLDARHRRWREPRR